MSQIFSLRFQTTELLLGENCLYNQRGIERKKSPQNQRQKQSESLERNKTHNSVGKRHSEDFLRRYSETQFRSCS